MWPPSCELVLTPACTVVRTLQAEEKISRSSRTGAAADIRVQDASARGSNRPDPVATGLDFLRSARQIHHFIQEGSWSASRAVDEKAETKCGGSSTRSERHPASDGEWPSEQAETRQAGIQQSQESERATCTRSFCCTNLNVAARTTYRTEPAARPVRRSASPSRVATSSKVNQGIIKE